MHCLHDNTRYVAGMKVDSLTKCTVFLTALSALCRHRSIHVDHKGTVFLIITVISRQQSQPQTSCLFNQYHLYVPDIKPRSGPGKIVIKNLKFSSVYEETVRQVAEQAKRKAEQYEEGELSEDSSENKETVPTEDDTLVLSPGIHLEVTFLDMFAK